MTVIVYNLCDNAIKYNRRGGKVDVIIKNEETPPLLLVRNTGIGINPEYQERIFERFYHVDKSHSKQVGGTGLGLSIVKHAAQIHNARIELHSVKGGGDDSDGAVSRRAIVAASPECLDQAFG